MRKTEQKSDDNEEGHDAGKEDPRHQVLIRVFMTEIQVNFV